MSIGSPHDLIIEYTKKIADAVAGEEQTAYTGNDDALRHALYRIGDHFEKNALPTKMANQAASSADSVSGLVTDFNALLTALKTAGLMEADSQG